LPTVASKPKVRILLPDQLGPHFVDDKSQKILLVVPHDLTFSRQLHIQKAIWWMSAILHRVESAVEPIEIIECKTLEEFIKNFNEQAEVIGPTSFQARKLFGAKENFLRLPSRGFVTSENVFQAWVADRQGKRLRLEDFYRFVRLEHRILIDDDGEPAGGSWNYDSENRLPPPKLEKLALAENIYPAWDWIDEAAYLKIEELSKAGYQFIGKASRNKFFASSRKEALTALNDFLKYRLELFGPYEDASLRNDWQMSHSLLSGPMNIGLLDPKEVIKKAEIAYQNGAPLNSVEGFVRQILGWRDYVWHLYWYFGEDYVTSNNHFSAKKELPTWMRDLSSVEIKANCLKHLTDDLNDRAWLHHIQRLMILGNWAMQHEIDPKQLVDWFDRAFIDGHPWVMAANVIGMSQYADGGRMSTKPYASGGAYINKMSNFCKGCAYQPQIRVGPTACPFTAGYWKFVNRHKEEFQKNPRISQAVFGLRRLSDLEELLHEESNEI
jgi:deoxyribodipyrimidine photolyase-related protein